MKKNIVLILVVIITFSCSNEHEEIKKEIRHLLKVDLPNNFIIENFKTSSAIGDYSKKYKIILTKKDFLNLYYQIDIKTYNKEKEGIYNKTFVVNDYTYYFVEIDSSKNSIYFIYIND